MLANLKDQEIVNRESRFGGSACDRDFASVFGVVKFILDVARPAFHPVDPGRDLIVDEHWDLEVPFRERVRNVSQMCADLVAGGRVLGVIRRDRDNASIWLEQKVVGGRGLGETHSLLPASHHVCVFGLGGRRLCSLVRTLLMLGSGFLAEGQYRGEQHGGD